jgi:hypothetical protein
MEGCCTCDIPRFPDGEEKYADELALLNNSSKLDRKDESMERNELRDLRVYDKRNRKGS